METPPRTWGRRCTGWSHPTSRGNTPTHVGKTKSYVCFFRVVWKHPHARGEDKLNVKGGKAGIETPPRTWGRRCTEWSHPTSRGNTPTHVGKTRPSKDGTAPRGKHPHARGEDSLSVPADRAMRETPPRTWGRQAREHPPTQELGNTPTHVGKTGVWREAESAGQKHPHARGEDQQPCPDSSKKIETPPRTWGRQREPDHRARPSGNTPTHVGKTVRLAIAIWPAGKHPHARGEDAEKFSFGKAARETPPRTWGRHVLVNECDPKVRNTPTHVGKTRAQQKFLQ